MVKIWERSKPLQLISPVNTDHAMQYLKNKEKTKIFMNCDDLSFITTMQKTLKPSKKECFNPQDGWEKTSYPGISAERYVQKYEMQVASKKVY